MAQSGSCDPVLNTLQVIQLLLNIIIHTMCIIIIIIVHNDFYQLLLIKKYCH